MTRRVALFRGIAVGGRNLVPMAELRASFTALGFSDVVSIIGSGNVCFDSDDQPDTIRADIGAAVAARFSIDVPLTLRTGAEIDAALTVHPFTLGDIEAKLHHIMFLADLAPADAVERIGDHSPDKYSAIGREIHVRYPQGSARSKLTVNLVDSRLETVATARNLPTVEKIAAALRTGETR